MKKYGSRGSYVTIDGDNIHIKIMWSKADCTFSDITNIEFDPQIVKQGGALKITTTNSKLAHIIPFRNEERDDFTELYNIIKEKIAPFVAERSRQADRRSERARQLDEEGVAYCPKCISTSLAVNASGGTITCLKCGHHYAPGK